MDVMKYISSLWGFIKRAFTPKVKGGNSQIKGIDNTKTNISPIFGASRSNTIIKDNQDGTPQVATIEENYGAVTQTVHQHITHKMGEEEAIDYINRVVGKDISRLKEQSSDIKATLDIISNNHHAMQTELLKSFSKKSDTFDQNKIDDPSVQATINNALVEGARKGKKIDLEVLSNLVVQKLSSNTSEILDNVTDTALETIHKINKNQITLLTLIFWMRDIKIIDASADGFTNLHNQMSTLVEDIQTLSYTNIGQLQSHCLLQLHMLSNNIYDNLKKRYDFLPPKEEDLDAEQHKSLIMLIDLYKRLTAGRVELLPAGKLIAAMHLESALAKDLDYKVWVN